MLKYKRGQRYNFNTYDTMQEIQHCLCCKFPNDCVDCYGSAKTHENHVRNYKTKKESESKNNERK